MNCHMGAGTRAWVLQEWQSSQPLSHLSSSTNASPVGVACLSFVHLLIVLCSINHLITLIASPPYLLNKHKTRALPSRDRRCGVRAWVVLSEKQEKPPRGFTAEVNGRPRIQFVKAKGRRGKQKGNTNVCGLL